MTGGVSSSDPTRRQKRQLDVASLALMVSGLITGAVSYWLIVRVDIDPVVLCPSVVAVTIGALNITKLAAWSPVDVQGSPKAVGITDTLRPHSWQTSTTATGQTWVVTDRMTWHSEPVTVLVTQMPDGRFTLADAGMTWRYLHLIDLDFSTGANAGLWADMVTGYQLTESGGVLSRRCSGRFRLGYDVANFADALVAISGLNAIGESSNSD